MPPDTVLKLIRGRAVLGTIVLDASKYDFPWFAGTFRSLADFEPVRMLFVRELGLLNEKGADSEEWEQVWSEISSEPLSIVGPDGSIFTTDPLVHIDGADIRWR